MTAQKTFKTLLVASTALAFAAPGLAAEETPGEATAVDDPTQTSAFDVITHTRALRSVPVVNHEGETLGEFYDIVVSGQDRRVLYALLARPDEQSQVSEDDQAGPDQTAADETASDQAATDQPPSDEAASEESGEETLVAYEEEPAEGMRLYPIPFGALQIVDAELIEAQPAAGQSQTDVGEDDEGAGQDPAAMEETGQDPAAMEEAGQDPASTEQTRSDQIAGEMTEAPADELSEQPPGSLEEMTVDDVVGMDLVNQEGETIADIEHIVVGPTGDAEALVGVGGFLGIGEKMIAIPVAELELSQDGSALVTTMTEAQLKEDAPAVYDETAELPGDTNMATLIEASESHAAAEEPAGDAASEPDAGAEATTAAGADAESQSAASDETAASEQQAAAEEERAAELGDWRSLEGKVLVIDITRDELEKAPSFPVEEFPAMADREWHMNVIAFYEEVLTEGMSSVDLPRDLIDEGQQ